MSLRQDRGGPAEGGLEALFAPDPLERRVGSTTQSRWAAEAAYGLPAFGGRFIGAPHAGLGLAPGTRDWQFGWRLSPVANDHARSLSFGLRATRRESDQAQPEHAAGFEFKIRW